jgi:amidohydrolase
MNSPDLRDRVVARIESLASELVELSHRVHAAAELGFAERESVATVVELLSASGFDAESGGYGLDTAFRVGAGVGSPHVALFAEYDALPDIGHGCGHNIICATAVGAFLGAAVAVTESGGAVTLFGTPAEENGSGKELLARAGAFDDVDAVLMLHPGAGDTVVDVANNALRSVEVTYHGVPAHAAAAPAQGRNALDAVVAAYQGVAALRQHIGDDDRVHGIITDGGSATNVVPALAKARFLLRCPDVAGLVEFSRRVQDILDGAALITGTRLEARWDQVPPCLPVRTNRPLADRFAGHYGRRGNPITRGAGLMHGSTDLGNVSVRVPAIHPMIGVAPPGTALHTAEFADCAVSEAADVAVIDGAVALALTAVDYLTDPVLRGGVTEHFEAQGGALDVVAVLTPPSAR